LQLEIVDALAGVGKGAIADGVLVDGSPGGTNGGASAVGSPNMLASL
jgi:hypothetical protein